MTTTRPLGLAVFTALLVAGLALAGCGDSAGFAESGPISAQTSEALDLLPADAELAGMIDFAAARESGSVGPLMDGPMSPFGRNGGDMDDFVRLTGFDPATDLDRVYLAGSAQRETGALVVLARFDRDRVERALGEEAGDELVRSEVEGVPLWTQTEGDGGALALPNDRMMLAGTEAAVRGMLERMARGTRGLSADAEFVALVQKARHRDDAWFVARGGGAPFLPTQPAEGVAESSVVSVDFQSSGLALDAYLVPRPGAAAGDVADVTRGAVSAARVEAADTPELLDMLDGVDVDEEGDGVRITATIPQSVLDQSVRG